MDQSSKGNGSSKTTKSKKRLIKSLVIKVDNVDKKRRSGSHGRNKDYERNHKRRRKESREYGQHSHYGVKNEGEHRRNSQRIEGQNRYYGELIHDEVRQRSEKINGKSYYGEQTRDEVRRKSEKIKEKSFYGEQNIDEVRQKFEKINIKSYYGEQTRAKERLKSGKICYGEQNNIKWREQKPKNICRKPCSFFNSFGNCRFLSGHYIGFTKQLHICSCCLDFLGEERYHSAFDCHLKKKICERENESRLKEGRRKNCSQYDQEENNNPKEITDEKIINWKRTVKNDQVEDNNPKRITDEKIISWKRNVKVLPELRKPANFQGTGQLKSINYLEVNFSNNVQAGSNMKKELEIAEQAEEDATTKPQLNIKDKVKNVVKQTLNSQKMEIKTEELNSETTVMYLKEDVPQCETKVKLEKVESERDLISANEKTCKLSNFYTNAEYFETEDEVGRISIKTEGANSTETFEDNFTVNNSVSNTSSFSPNDHQEVENAKLSFLSIHNYLDYPDISSLTAQIELHLTEPLCLSSMKETECVATRLSCPKEAEYIGKGDSNNNSTKSQPFGIYNSHNRAIRMTQSAITVKSEPMEAATSDSNCMATHSASETYFTCDLCGVNASSNMDLGLHLLGRDHKDRLKAWLDVNV